MDYYNKDMVKVGQIKLDYYYGAYGPTIRIDLSSKSELIFMKDILQQLSDGRITEFRFHDLPFVNFTGIKAFFLRKTPTQLNAKKKVEIIKKKNSLPIAIWSNDSQGWVWCLGLVEGLLIDENLPAHQYLSKEGIDDALITIAYLES